MAINNGYATLAEFKNYKKVTSSDAIDDGVIEDLIEGASRYIDAQTGRIFYARTETRKYDLPEGRELKLDEDLLTVTTLTNGDGDVIASSEYILLPPNTTAKRAIKLKQGSAEIWELDSDSNSEQVISVAGTWGLFASVPDDIKIACLEITRAAYNRRSGQKAEGVARVTAAGVVIEPMDVPKHAMGIVKSYRRMT